ncbi:MAG: hypothetical protein K2X81_16830, partial [Candidatus Obscuribacterales bacterium]|nr:hypothetical protein [Candidatus Obscuribacterales bacterium]
MKCIKCSADNMLKDRTDGRCNKCRHPFAFDPRKNSSEVMNDKMFQNCLSLISVNNSLKFTDKQFYYFLNSMKAVQARGAYDPVGFLLVFFGFFLLVMGFALIKTEYIWVLFLGIFLLVLAVTKPAVYKALGIVDNKRIVIPFHNAVSFLKRWAALNDPISALLPETQRALPSGTVSSELLDYSFDRLLVTETDEIANFLISNNFHFENNCAILSIKRYPTNLFSTIMKMLSNNQELKVYALHNCSWKGISILQKLRTESEWFKDKPDLQIIDIGLLPRQFEKRRVFVEKDPLSIPTVVDD